MIWQDVVISVGQVVFFVALIPSIIGEAKPALSTSLMTATIGTIFAITFATLDLWFATATATLSAGAWWTLAYQKWRQQNS